MTPFDAEIVRKKLSVIARNLVALEGIEDLTLSRYEKDLLLSKAIERLLQEIIDGAIDINTYIIVQLGQNPPEDYYRSFILAGELKIITTELAEKLAPSTGLRNRLIHEYDTIDNVLMLEALRECKTDYNRYVQGIEAFLQKQIKKLNH